MHLNDVFQSVTFWLAHHDLWNCLEAITELAAKEQGREGFLVKDPGQKPVGTLGLAEGFISSLLSRALVTECTCPLPSWGKELQKSFSHWRQTKNRAKDSWSVTEGCGDRMGLGGLLLLCPWPLCVRQGSHR